ncbi:MAG: DUF998 domain-containing protein [Woeseiaceae bacterium]|nr:DUF998 domain-containing protein [Woeseiaceae bacterium]
MASSATIRVIAWCGIAAPVIRVLSVIVFGYLDPIYVQSRDFINELGADGAPHASWMNVAILANAALVVVFGAGLAWLVWPRILFAIGAATLAVSGLIFVGVGTNQCDAGCIMTAMSEAQRAHLMYAVIGMFLQANAVLIVGVGAVLAAGWRRYGYVSLALGAIAVAAMFALVTGQGGADYSGALQKLYQLSIDIWMFALAVGLLRNADRST